MKVAKTVEVTATSDTGFDDAIRRGLESAHQNHGKIRGVWITKRTVSAEDTTPGKYRVTMSVAFLDPGTPPPPSA